MGNREDLRVAEARRRLGEKSLVLKREIHARRMLAKAVSRLRRAETIVKRWKKRVRYYENWKPRGD